MNGPKLVETFDSLAELATKRDRGVGNAFGAPLDVRGKGFSGAARFVAGFTFTRRSPEGTHYLSERLNQAASSLGTQESEIVREEIAGAIADTLEHFETAFDAVLAVKLRERREVMLERLEAIASADIEKFRAMRSGREA